MPDKITRRQALRRTAGLLGGMLSAPLLSGLVGGCSIPDDEWTPILFSEKQAEMMRLIAGIIIPKTDTPGAAEANVHRFVDEMVGESYPADDRKRFMRGLDDFNQHCRDKYQKSFLELAPEARQAEIVELDRQTFEDASEVAAAYPSLATFEDPSFFRMTKELVLVGYYTSEIGASQELKINIVPGRYDGAVPFEEIGRAWAA